ncbi:MAG TPA: hypothetical protein VHX15_20235 [Frankiaceae bacterium]|nr:hypothetical protein [Frankiaceae bacterium]
MTLGSGVPQFVTHYHLPDRRPFLNLSDLGEAEAFEVMGALLTMRTEGLQNRSFGRVYLKWRQATESRMRALFLEQGGEPVRRTPHYFVLGESRWYAGLALDMQALSIPLDCLPSSQASFTLVDSFTAMGLGPEFGVPHTPEPHQAKLYRFEDLAETVRAHGLPGDEPPADGYKGYEWRPVTQFIEVQLWCDDPIADFLKQS